ncbi:hypothetical protein C0585_03890 [Candidatus Woesearchaeota archaeon]|nr:MAG: hypothetical protein C0585_03890 [Candidatus Woesearchaeota archaeon]
MKLEKSELIGKEAIITTHNNTFNGKIIDESKNMIHLQTKEGVKKVIKKQATIKIDGKTIQGEKITKRPEDRIKLSKR